MRGKTSLAETLSSVQVMIGALTTHVEALKKRGVDESAIAELEQLRARIEQINSEQERLKAELKLKTEALYQGVAELEKKYAQVKKIVKMDFPPAQWIEFGVKDKR